MGRRIVGQRKKDRWMDGWKENERKKGMLRKEVDREREDV